MRRLVVVLALLAALPTVVDAQPRLMGGGGFTAPSGDVTDVADPGYHMRVGMRLGVPTIPVAIQADGDYHKLGAATVAHQVWPYIETRWHIFHSFSPHPITIAGRWSIDINCRAQLSSNAPTTSPFGAKL